MVPSVGVREVGKRSPLGEEVEFGFKLWCVLGQWLSEVFLQENETSTIRQGMRSRRPGANAAVAGELCGRHPHR